MSDHEKLPLSGDDLKKALRDAYGQGRVYGRQQKYPETPEITNAPRDAWIRQYIARLLAVTPITTAPTPTDRVGEDVFADFDEANYKPDLASAIAIEVMSLPWTHAVLASDDIQDEMKAQEAHCNRYGEVQEVVSAVLDRARTTPHKIMITAISETVAEAATLAAQAGADSTAVLSGSAADAIAPAAPAPSDPAGAGGDLGGLERLREALRFYADRDAWTGLSDEPWRLDFESPDRDGHGYEVAEAALARSGQPVASTPGQKGAGCDWQPISEAPLDTEVEVRVGQMTFLAKLVPGAAMDTNESVCDQWQATREGEHPPCWSDGCCWTVNEDENCSLWPEAWRSLAPSESPTTKEASDA